MNRIHGMFAATLLLVVSAAGVSIAESTPEATKYLSALSEVAQKQSFQADYTLVGKASAMGQSVRVEMSGRVTQSDRAHQRTTMNMTMSMKPDPAGEEMTMTMTSLVVADGTTIWTEMDNPMMGGKQVMKIAIDKLDVAGSGSPSSFQRQMAALDPLGQMRQLAELFDFEVAGRDEEKVTLQAEVTQEGLDKMGIAPDLAAGVKSFAIEIDEQTGFVREVRIAGDEPILTMRVTSFEKLDAKKIEPSQFSYTPPAGVHVVDLAAVSGG